MIRAAASVAAVGVLLAGGSALAGGYDYVTIDAPVANVVQTVVDGINNHGLAEGYYILPGDPTFGGNYVSFTVKADGSDFTSFTRAGYQQTGASGINDAGDIVGVSVGWLRLLGASLGCDTVKSKRSR